MPGWNAFEVMVSAKSYWSERKKERRSDRHAIAEHVVEETKCAHVVGELLAHGIGESRRKGTRLTILLLDIDNFQRVNNTLGHSDGDDVLVEVARRLHRRLDQGGVLARVGADEYAILLSGGTSADDDAALADDLLKALNQPHLTSKGQEIYISASIGIASFPHDANDTANLLRNAEIAMMHSK